ncbi:MAG: hypothetical protein KTR31_30380 [Myxococcales bacterium]|nr:hypothetical protein [Myxococcales bacterium]
MRWRGFERRRQERRALALHAAQKVGNGEWEPLRTVLDGWNLGPYLPAAQRVVADLLVHPPTIPGEEAHVELAESLPEPPSGDEGSDVDAHVHRALAMQRVQGEPVSGARAGVWCLARLAGLAEDVHQRHHLAWKNHTYAPHALDEEVRQLWRCWFEEQPWGIRQRWHELFFDRAAAAFRSELGGGRGADVVLRDLEEAFFYGMLGRSSKNSGWAELATRVLETTGDEPSTGLAAYAGPEVWQLAAECVVQRGHLPQTSELAWPDAGNDLGRAWCAKTDLPRHWGAYVNLHALIRVVDRWSGGAVGTDSTWNSIAQNRGRARGRLRAAMRMVGPEGGWTALLGVDALYARTRDALGWMCMDWARAQRMRQFSFHLDQTPAGAQCLPDPVWRDPLDTEEVRILETWAVLVAMKGRFGRLRDWSQSGSHGQRDSTFGRLLQNVPEPLHVGQGYDRVRAAICAHWPTVERTVLERATEVAALRADADIAQAFEACIAPWWHPSVPIPQVQYRRYRQNCAALVAAGGRTS